MITYLFLQKVSLSVLNAWLFIISFIFITQPVTSYIIYYKPPKSSTEYTIINFLLSFIYNPHIEFSMEFTNTD